MTSHSGRLVQYTPVDLNSEEYQPSSISYYFAKAIADRLISDKKVGVYLSGGLDSSLIYGAVQNMDGRDVPSFSVTFDNDLLDESKYQQLLVDGSREHFSLRVGSDYVPRHFANAIQEAENLTFRAAFVPMWGLSKLVPLKNRCNFSPV